MAQVPDSTLTYPNKPPKEWFESKRRLGMSNEAIGRIWFRNYTDEKRFLTWMLADANEWAQHGIQRPTA